MQTSIKKVLFSIVLTVVVGLLAYQSYKPKYLVVNSLGVESYSNFIPKDTNCIVYEVLPNDNFIVISK